MGGAHVERGARESAPTPAGGPSRRDVIAYVAGLIAAHRLAFVTPRAWTVGRQGAIDNLSRELGLMQGRSPEGDALARRWAFLLAGPDHCYAPRV